jgi:solute carrier family 45 protein 1/2/4
MAIYSDRCRSRFGRRRPYIVFGTIGTIISLLNLAWLKGIVKEMTRLSHGDSASEKSDIVIIVLAIFWIYCLNIAIQAIQMGLRTLVIENCPEHQQSEVSAWTSKFTGVGNIVGYIAGTANLPAIFSLHRLSQFQLLCVIASLYLSLTVTISCYVVRENKPGRISMDMAQDMNLKTSLSQLVRTLETMPWVIWKVCQVQLFAWMGWFPFLFYAST